MMRCEFDEKETERYIVYLPISPAGVRMTTSACSLEDQPEECGEYSYRGHRKHKYILAVGSP
jgi:hypothetical protein